ncbi:hypothetical protein ACFYOV_17790 [Streptomyces sp. NPDC005931]|uniref:hypothetical protein n=1 Tax=Streptomyces sp. NPDC005931 TaxID=3364737 RepID=UPI0036828138
MWMTRDLRGGGWPGALARVLVLATVQVGVVTALVWAAVGIGVGGSNVWEAVAPVAFAMICLAGAIGLWLSTEEDHGWSFVVAAVVVVAAGMLLFSEDRMVRQQTLHDAGVQATGAVVRQWDRQGFSEATGRYTEVRLADGTVLTAEDDLDTRRPEGTPVVVTYDPHMRVTARVGPRPGAPTSEWRTAGFVLLCAGALALAAANANSSRLWDHSPTRVHRRSRPRSK